MSLYQTTTTINHGLLRASCSYDIREKECERYGEIKKRGGERGDDRGKRSGKYN
jgi:hypothetical protein